MFTVTRTFIFPQKRRIELAQIAGAQPAADAPPLIVTLELECGSAGEVDAAANLPAALRVKIVGRITGQIHFAEAAEGICEDLKDFGVRPRSVSVTNNPLFIVKHEPAASRSRFTEALLGEGVKVAPGPAPVTGRGLIARENVREGEVIFDLRADAKKDAPLFHRTNHSCNPSARVDSLGGLVAKVNIPAGGEVTINYLVSCDFTDAFDCECGELFCAGRIEKEFGSAPRVSPLVIVSGQPGAAVIKNVGNSTREPEEVPCLN